MSKNDKKQKFSLRLSSFFALTFFGTLFLVGEASATTQTFGYVGNQVQSIAITNGTSVTIDVKGAGGGMGDYWSEGLSSNGSNGSNISGTFTMSGNTLYFCVGQRGFIGGSDGNNYYVGNPGKAGWQTNKTSPMPTDGDYDYSSTSGGGGGGATVVSYNSDCSSPLFVAAGGNGGGSEDGLSGGIGGGTNVSGGLIIGQNGGVGGTLSTSDGTDGSVSVTFTSGPDTTAPTITSVSSDKANGNYKTGEVIDIDVTFSEVVTSIGNVTVILETGTVDRTCTFTVSNSTTGTCNYTVQAGDATLDLTTASISGTIKDAANNAMTNFVPTATLAANKNILIDTAVPATVTGIGSSGNPQTQVNLTWSAASDNIGVTGYNVYHYNGSAYVKINPGTVTATNYTDSGRTAGTDYLYKVTAYDAAGNESAQQTSGFTARTADPTAPVAPTIGTATAGNAQATVNWTNNSDGGSPITGFTITPYIGTTPQTPTIINGNPTLTTANITGLTNGTAYSFKVTATNVFGSTTSVASNVVTLLVGYDIVSLTGEGGTMVVTDSLSLTSIASGSSRTLNYTASSGYILSHLYLDGVEQSGTPAPSFAITLSNITADHTVEVIFDSTSYSNIATFTSNVKKFDINGGFGSMIWDGSVPSGTTVKMRVRSTADVVSGTSESNWVLKNPSVWSDACNITIPTPSGNTYTVADISGSGCLKNDNDLYVQYQIILATNTGSVAVPWINNVRINSAIKYPTDAKEIISSKFDTGNNYNAMQDIAWTGSNLGSDVGQGTIKFQIKTAANATGLDSALWCGPGDASACNLTPGASNSFYTTNTGSNVINSTQRDNINDRWFQYAAFLTSNSNNDGTTAPILTNVTASYSFNTPPIISNLSSVSQGSDGKVNVSYTIKESKGFNGIMEQTAAYAHLLYKPGANVKLSSAIDSNVMVVDVDSGGAPIPSSGQMMIGTELINFSSKALQSGNVYRLTVASQGRGYSFNGTASYKTISTNHEQNDPVYFVAKNVTGSASMEITGLTDIASTKTITWWPAQASTQEKTDLAGNNMTGLVLKVVANDGTAFNPVGESNTPTQAVDLQAPTVSSVSVDLNSVSELQKTSGIFGIGKTVPVKVQFSEPVTTVGDLTLKLDMGNSRTTNCVINISGTAVDNKTCSITINESDISNDLSLASGAAITGTIKDIYANTTVDPTAPTKKDLHDSPDIKVDGIKPTIASVTETSNNSNNKKAKVGDKITLSIQTSEALKSGIVPSVTILGHSVTASGASSPYSAEYTLTDTDIEGEISFAITLTDTAENVSNAANQSNTSISGDPVIFDRTKPTLSNISATSNNADNKKAKAGDTVTLTFTSDEPIQAPIVKIAKDGSNNLQNADSVTNVENIYSAIYLMKDTDKEEDISYSIEFKDEAGNNGDAVNGNTGVNFDRTKPTLAEVTKVVTPTNIKTPAYTFNTNEEGVIAYQGECNSDATDAINGDNTVTFNQLTDEVYSACKLTVTDPTGNTSNQLSISEFEIDTLGRNISIVYPNQGAHLNQMDVKFTLEENIQSGNIVLTDQDNQQTTMAIASDKLGANTEHTQTISNLAEGIYTIEIIGKDLAGNDMQTASVNGIVYDTTAPTLAITISDYFNNFSDESDVSFDISNNNETLKDGKITFKDSSNTLPDQVCNLKATSLTNGNHQNVNLTNECNESITLVDGTSYNVVFSATDLATNTQSTTISSKTYDITAPEVNYFKSTSLNSTADNPSTSGNINITAVCNEEVANGSIDVRVGPMSANVTAGLNFTTGNELSGSFTIGAPRTGYDTTPDYLKVENILSGSVTDRAGNVRTYSSENISDEQNLANNSSTIVIDTTPPILQSFTIEDNENTTAFKEAKTFTLVANYNKTIQANGNVKVILNTGSAKHEITLSNASASKKLIATYTVAANENAEELKVEEVISQDVKDGKGTPLNTIGNILNGDYVANASNDSLTNLSGFKIDTSSPTLGQNPISIQNTNGKTSDTTPKITLDASDNFDFTTGKVFYKLSGTSWCGPVDYKAGINQNDADNEINLTNASCGGSASNEVKTLIVKFVDSATNESSEANATVEFDSKEPILQSFTTETESGTYGTGTQIKIIATYNEPISLGSVNVILNNTVPVILDTIENGNQLTTGNHPYVIGTTGSGESTGKLKVASIQTQNVADISDPVNTLTNTDIPAGDNLDKDKTITIDTDAPTATLTADRFSEENKFKLSINPDDLGVSMDGMTAQVKILSSDTSCNFTEATNETFTSFPETFTYDDTDDSIRKACVKLTDKVGNISQALEVKAPNTPQQFDFMDLTNDSLTGAILTWAKPQEEGSGMFSKYDLISCESSDTSACTPDQSHEITNKDQNYYVFAGGLSKTKSYCYKVVFKDLSNNISKPSSTICGIPGQGPTLSNTDVDFKEIPLVANITQSSAKVIFETINKNDSNSPLATTAKVEMFTTQDLTGEPLKTVNDDLNVFHSIDITGLEVSKKYYLRITVTDPTDKIKTLDYIQNPTLTLTTAGVLVSIDSISESIITDSKAVVNFTTNEESKCFIDFKENTVSSYNELSDNLEKDLNKNHSITLTQLLAQTAYDYKITCDDTKGVVITSSEHHFTTTEKGLTQGEVDANKDSKAPEITSIALADVTGENATVTWTTNEAANSLLAYEVEGADFMLMAGDYTVNADASKYSTVHSVQLKGLLPASKYSFSVMSTDLAGNIGQSALSTFTTKQPSSLSSIKVQSKALGQATITWETGSATSSLVEYGLTTSYGQKKEDSSKVKQHSITLSDLTPGETYHFRVKGEDDQKNIFASSDITFQPKAPPKISDFKVDGITEHGAVVTFNTNVSTNAIVSFENTDDKDNSGFQGRPDFVSKHEIKLKDLASGATFSIKLKVRDEDGNETEETFPNFTTTKDEVPPKVDRVKTDSALTQNDKVQAIISWSTDELSTGEIIYKEGRNGNEKKFEVNSAPSFSHIGVITSFKSGIVYYFKVVSEDQAGNKVTSSDYALLTPKQRQNIIQIIIGNFTDIFGWAKF